ncbi:MAG: hypothetical protein JXB88_24810 [Spirochaetales bacterium]|nr:hypothetical protein [Spirochaetales bacterium]
MISFDITPDSTILSVARGNPVNNYTGSSDTLNTAFWLLFLSSTIFNK